MPWVDAIRLALAQIRVQKLKSFFTLLGVTIGVMFLIAVVSIVEGMGNYMEHDFAAKLFGVNTFELRRRPDFADATEEQWREWQRRLDWNARRTCLVAAWAICTSRTMRRVCPIAGRIRSTRARTIRGP